MMMPSIFGENLFNDWFDFSFPDVDGKYYGRHSADQVMRTDVKEKDDAYEVEIDLPGFKKDEIKAELKEGYLTISAAKNVNNDEKKDGKYIRQERFTGNVSRSFYVGDAVTEEDVKAKFEDGILRLSIPKKDARTVETKKTIAIEG